MEQNIAPSVQIEAAAEAALASGLADPERLAEIGRLGARLVLQRQVKVEAAASLGSVLRLGPPRAKPGAPGSRNGHRPRRVQTAGARSRSTYPVTRPRNRCPPPSGIRPSFFDVDVKELARALPDVADRDAGGSILIVPARQAVPG